MKKFEVGKYYKPATMPSIDALKCIKVTNCYVWFYDDEKECEVKAKKGEGTHFNGNDVEKRRRNHNGRTSENVQAPKG